MAEQVTALLNAAQLGELSNVHTYMLERVERELFCQAIKLAHGNQSQAARWLGVARLTMREKLAQLARGREFEPFDRSLDVQVSRLRKLIEADAAVPRYIQTVWGIGYVFVPDGTN